MTAARREEPMPLSPARSRLHETSNAAPNKAPSNLCAIKCKGKAADIAQLLQDTHKSHTQAERATPTTSNFIESMTHDAAYEL
jgi:hypothetical protein